MPLRSAFHLFLGFFALAFSLVSIGVARNAIMNLIFVSTCIILYAQGLTRALLWALIGGLIFETVSPFPQGTFILALLAATTLMYHFLIRYVTHRSVPGIMLGSALGALVFEMLLLLFARIVYLFVPGFIPSLNIMYLTFLCYRIGSTLLILAFVVIIMRHLSPHARGTRISYARSVFHS